MYNVAAITGGKYDPSSNFRLRVLHDDFLNNEIKLTEYCPVINKYPPKSIPLRPFWFTACFLERLSFILKAKNHDVTILQRELISTLPSIEKLLPGNKILDVDDAIYMYRRGLAAKNAAEASIGVVCGNDFLAEKFSQWNSSITIIPTGVDVTCIKPNNNRLNNEKKLIGWIGTPGNLKYMEHIAESIILVMKSVKNVEFVIVTSHKDAIPEKLKPYTTFLKWYPGVEVDLVPNWTLGIMPLIDDEWARGKCSFKMLQYFSAGIPVVASPVGMNNKILESADVGYSAKNKNDWTDGIIQLLSNPKDNNLKGINGRKLVEAEYSLSIIAEKWKKTLSDWI